jgi:endonuclease I
VGSTLKTQLHYIIKDHNNLSYNSLWDHFKTTDATFAGFVWDIYSDTPCSDPPYLFVFDDDQDTGTGGTQEGDVYNREHSMPRSWFGGAVSPMNSDIYHIYPVDKHVNAIRDNHPYGMVNNPQWTSQNGSRLGPNTAGNSYSGTAFEPIDEYKGDLARTFLYMITRYEDRIEDWTFSEEGNTMFDHNTYPGYQPWAIEMLMEWHRNDPVSQRERLRNDAIYNLQNNRNPFIDHPVFAEKIWGDTTIVTVYQTQETQITMYPNPARYFFSFNAPFLVETLEIHCIRGKRILVLNPENFSGESDISMLAPGIYIVRFIGNSKFISRRLVIY